MSWMIRILAILVAVFLAGPLFIVVPMSFSSAQSLSFPPPGYSLANYTNFFFDPNWIRPLINSVIIASSTSLLTMLLVVPAAFAVMRNEFFGRGLLRLLLMMPMIVPTIVMALGYYIYLGDLGLVQSYTGVILAHTCIAIPVSFLILTAALKGFDRSVEQAAMGLGATPLTTFRLVTFPMLRPGFLVAALFAFVSSFDEAVIALFISGRDRATLPRQMFNSFRQEADPTISAAASFLFILVLSAVAASRIYHLLRKRAGGAGSDQARA